ncbi:ChaN family lipoprotein [Profundibacter sp.]
MKRILISAVLTYATHCGAWAGEITSDDLANLPSADVVILGEVHDNGLHHLGQAAAIEAIRPKAVVFEMLTPKQASVITPELLGDQVALAAALEWENSGWPDFALYYPVFAGLQGVHVFGAARPRDEVRRSFSEGAAAVFGAGADALGLVQDLPSGQLELRMQEQFNAHCEAMPLEMMGGMVEAQRFRDAAFGDVVLRAYEATGGPVVLIAGNGHTRKDWGVPAVLAQVVPDLTVLTVAHLEVPVQDVPPFDLWVITQAAEREDPCLAFK